MTASTEAASSSATPARPQGRRFVVDEVWAGSSAAYDAISDGSIVYVGYYDRDRYLTVARVDTRTGSVERKRLESRFRGWDAHNYVTMALDRDGLLHVAGNMHGGGLVYGRTEAAGKFESLRLVNRMVGADESRTTYPAFLRLPDGRLGFSYRSGTSGNGREIVNRFDGRSWSRLIPESLFAPERGGPPTNAYHTGFRSGPDGRVHVAWVWRRTPDARTNFTVGYAQSVDMVHWTTSRGQSLSLPITPRTGEVVDLVGEGAGLCNCLKLGFDMAGRPIISYLKFDAEGFTQIYHARPRAEGGWQVVPSTAWTYRWDFGGTGTLPVHIGFSGVQVDHGELVETFNHLHAGRGRLRLDPVTLLASPEVPPPLAMEAPKVVTAPPPNPVRVSPAGPYFDNIRPVRNLAGPPASIHWKSLGVDNQDRPRTCASSGLDEGCSMTSTLEIRRP